MKKMVQDSSLRSAALPKKLFKQTEMTKHRLSELFTRLSEKANLSKQYAQRTVFASAPYLSRLCRRHTSMLASYRGSVEWTMHYTVALGYCLNRCALSERGCFHFCTRFLTPLRCVRNDNRATGDKEGGRARRNRTNSKCLSPRPPSAAQHPSFRRSKATEESQTINN